MPGSFTVVQQAWNDPDDHGAWKQVQDRYEQLIYNHARTALNLKGLAADELVIQVFHNLRRRFKNRNMGPIELPRGSFKSYVLDAVQSADSDRLRAEKRRSIAEAEVAKRNREANSDPIEELEAALDHQDLIDREVARCIDLYPEKKKSVHAEAKTWQMFLRVMLLGETAAHLDKVYEYDRPGTVAQYVRQVRERLFNLLALPCSTMAEKDCSTKILREVLKHHDRLHRNGGTDGLHKG